MKTQFKKKEDQYVYKRIDKDIYNNEIRKKNIDRFKPKIENNDFNKLPWNYDQQKLKELYTNITKQEERKTNRKQKVIKDNERRNNLGLQFLNDYDNEQIGNIKQTQKQKE